MLALPPRLLNTLIALPLVRHYQLLSVVSSPWSTSRVLYCPHQRPELSLSLDPTFGLSALRGLHPTLVTSNSSLPLCGWSYLRFTQGCALTLLMQNWQLTPATEVQPCKVRMCAWEEWNKPNQWQTNTHSHTHPFVPLTTLCCLYFDGDFGWLPEQLSLSIWSWITYSVVWYSCSIVLCKSCAGRSTKKFTDVLLYNDIQVTMTWIIQERFKRSCMGMFNFDV